MSNINEIKGRSRKGQFRHCPIRLEQRYLQLCLLEVKHPDEKWTTHASSRCFRTSGCLASFTLTHWLHFEVPKVMLFWISVTQKKGRDSGETFSFLQYKSNQLARGIQRDENSRPAQKDLSFENLPNTAKYMFHKEFHSFLPIPSANLPQLHFSDV